MAQLSRRHAVAGLAAVAAASTTRTRSVKAAEPVTVWWTQGFYEAENKAVVDKLAAWEKMTGTKVNLTIMNGPDLITKLIAAMQVGDVPDLVHSVTGDRFLVPRASWDDQLVDVTDVIESQKGEFHPTAMLGSRFYNAKLKKHAFYTVPIKCST
jgi:multiple sugar transport system substrate-binding protein